MAAFTGAVARSNSVRSSAESEISAAAALRVTWSSRLAPGEHARHAGLVQQPRQRHVGHSVSQPVGHRPHPAIAANVSASHPASS